MVLKVHTSLLIMHSRITEDYSYFPLILIIAKLSIYNFY
jgi:hypothetical protein